VSTRDGRQLPEGEEVRSSRRKMGNFEVGHMNTAPEGGYRRSRGSTVDREGGLFTNRPFIGAKEQARTTVRAPSDRSLSDRRGVVHSSTPCSMPPGACEEAWPGEGLRHALLDGRDTPPESRAAIVPRGALEGDAEIPPRTGEIGPSSARYYGGQGQPVGIAPTN